MQLKRKNGDAVSGSCQSDSPYPLVDKAVRRIIECERNKVGSSAQNSLNDHVRMRRSGDGDAHCVFLFSDPRGYRWNLQGYIRSWVFFPASSSIVYSLAVSPTGQPRPPILPRPVCSRSVLVHYQGNYRFCAKINRHHKSNNVYFVADLCRKELHQRCYDFDCRGFRSSPWHLEAVQPGDCTDEVTDELLRDVCTDRNFYRQPKLN